MASSGKWGQMKWREKSQLNDGLNLHRGMRPIFARFSFMTFARDVNLATCCWFNADAVAGTVCVCVCARRLGVWMAQTVWRRSCVSPCTKYCSHTVKRRRNGWQRQGWLGSALVVCFRYSHFLAACYLSWVVDIIGFCSNSVRNAAHVLKRYLRLFGGVTQSSVKQKAVYDMMGRGAWATFWYSSTDKQAACGSTLIYCLTWLVARHHEVYLFYYFYYAARNWTRIFVSVWAFFRWLRSGWFGYRTHSHSAHPAVEVMTLLRMRTGDIFALDTLIVRRQHNWLEWETRNV